MVKKIKKQRSVNIFPEKTQKMLINNKKRESKTVGLKRVYDGRLRSVQASYERTINALHVQIDGMSMIIQLKDMEISVLKSKKWWRFW